MTLIGLIGCGTWGKNILRDLIQLDCTVHVVDTDLTARSRASGIGAVQTHCHVDDLPACDGYVVAVPIPYLTSQCNRLLQYKKPIFSEKPLCLSLEDFNLLNDSGGSDYIFVMHKWVYHPGIEALRLMAQSGRIGKIEELCTTRHAWVDDFHGGDVFWTQSVHDLTIIKHILGYIPDQIRAIHVIENEDGLPVSFSAMLMGNRTTVVMSIGGRHCTKISSVSIQGKKGSAVLNNALDDYITVRDNGGQERISIDTTFPLYLELKAFVQYLHGGPSPRCNLHSVKEVTQAILNLRKQGIKNGSPQ